MIKLSVVLATRNEEKNIGRCLAAVKDIADEIIVFDEYSSDKTTKIAKSYGAKVFFEPHHDIFHVTKQKALEKAKGDWILQLDADEVVTLELADEIKNVIKMSDEKILARRPKDPNKWRLFLRHQQLIEERDGNLQNGEEVVAFFVPRRNMFLGKPLIHAGVYPDAVIRLVKRGKARLPGKSVHEQMQFDGRVAWLFNDLLHYDSPTLRRYIERLNRYTDLRVEEMKEAKTPDNFFNFLKYNFYKPVFTFLNLYLRHKGFKDEIRGFLWSALSASHFPIAYFKYITR